MTTPLWTPKAYSWGFFAHKRINRMAVMTLPTDLMQFYKKHIEFVTEHAVDPDKRRYASDVEAPRHYIDIDHYGTNPFEQMPRRWDEAVAKYSEDTLQAYGIVPWRIDQMVYYLQKAFEERDIDRILRTSSDLGHYIGDAHVPLHTTENYNGQLTNQVGIHGFWESRLPELFAGDYDYLTGRAQYISEPLDAAWDAVEASHAALDSVLIFEQELNEQFTKDQKYGYEQKGASTVRVYSRTYSTAYHERMSGMVERRMLKAILMVGSLWYTAWVDAGKPDLSKVLELTPTEQLNAEIEAEQKAFEKGKIKGRAHTP